MNDEELLKAVGRSARARQPLDERWEALAAGQLSAAEREKLLEEAATSDEAAEAYEAFRPLGAEFQARVVARVMADRGREAGSEAQRVVTPRVVAFRRRAPRFVGIPLALAASVLLAVGLVMFMRPGGAPALPGYGLTLEGQVTLMRGEAPPPATAPFATGNHFRLVLTPEQRVEGDVIARAYVLDGGEPEMLAAAPKISGDGAVLIEGEVGRDVQLPPGDSRLLVIVGRESKLPDASALAARLGVSGQEQTSDWAAWMLPVRSD
jgi:hypothetical protein